MSNRYDTLRHEFAGLPEKGGPSNQVTLKAIVHAERRFHGSRKVERAEARRLRLAQEESMGEIDSVDTFPHIPSSLLVFPESPEAALRLLEQREVLLQPERETMENTSPIDIPGEVTSPSIKPATVFHRVRQTIATLLRR